MTQGLPEGITADDEIEINWGRHEDGTTRIVSKLNGASVIVITDDSSVHYVPWLVASMPQILESAWEAIEKQDDTNQEEAP